MQSIATVLEILFSSIVTVNCWIPFHENQFYCLWLKLFTIICCNGVGCVFRFCASWCIVYKSIAALRKSGFFVSGYYSRVCSAIVFFEYVRRFLFVERGCVSE